MRTLKLTLSYDGTYVVSRGSERMARRTRQLEEKDRLVEALHEIATLSLASLDLEEILEPGRGEEGGPHPPPLQESVGRHRGTMDHLEFLFLQAQIPKPPEDRRGGIIRPGRDLEGPDHSLVEEGKIGEGPAGIDPHPFDAFFHH